jgi:formate/nitrite transporter FocA (FNT family)
MELIMAASFGMALSLLIFAGYKLLTGNYMVYAIR